MQLFRKLIIGTPLEKPARDIMRRLSTRRPTEWLIRIRRDEKNVARLLRSCLQDDSSCVDVGAHKGSFLVEFIRLAPRGTHYAFEPLPALADELRARFPGVEVLNCALSNRAGTSTFFHVPAMEAWSGLERQPYPRETAVSEIEVELRRLDDVIGERERIDFIKIDVEGAELEVLEGAQETIRRCRPVILFEHAKVHNQNYETTPEALHDFLADTCGLAIWDLAMTGPFTRDRFREVYTASFESGYDRNAQTNFVARSSRG
jgi:FkbM family methyltransferase